MMLKKRNLSLLIAFTLLIALFAGCGSRTEPQESSEDPAPSQAESSREDLPPPETTETVETITPDFSDFIAEKHALNDHTVGWLEVPGTDISDVVLKNPADTNNQYYLRLDFEKKYDFNGVYYVDFRGQVGPTRSDLGVNTCIYGHAMTDNPEKDTYDIKMGQLHNFRDEDFAREHPYIFYSTPSDNMVFEIIAVFYGNTDNPEFAYNDCPANPADFIKTIDNAVMPRSIYNYDVEYGSNDKFITLSTCIYDPRNGVTLLDHTKTQYRMGILAKLVDPDEPLKEEASFTVNENPIADPDGLWKR